MRLRVPVRRGAPEAPSGVASFVVEQYHDDGTATIRPSGDLAAPGIDGIVARLRNVREPRQRRALQLEAERVIDSLDGVERGKALAKYRGV